MNRVLEIIEKRIYVIFFIFFVGLIFFYNINKTTFIRPQGLHQWRQSVGASYAMNYYNYDLNIFDVRIYNNLSKNAESDLVLAEFPIFYYGIAVLYKIFGPNESIFRIVNFLIMFLGLFYLMKALIILLKDKIWALLITVLTFSSATLVYYSNSFLPDTTAYGLSFIAFYHIIRYSKSVKIKYLYYASLIYILAALLKPTSLILLIAFLGTYFFFFIFDSKLRKKYKFYHLIIPSILPIAITILWYTFMNRYHAVNGGSISLLHIRAYWMLDAETIAVTWDSIMNTWLDTYYHRSALIIALIGFIISFLTFNRKNGFAIIFNLISVIGGIGFFLLYFKSLRSHDYYLINIFYLIPFIVSLNVHNLINSKFPNNYKSMVKLGFVIYLGFLLIDARKEVINKLDGFNYWHTSYFYGLEDIQPILDANGIHKFDKVICMPDPSINISLNMMNRPGYTDFGFIKHSGKDRIEYFIDHGAKYLVILDKKYYKQVDKSYLKPFLENKLISHKNVDIFDLRAFKNYD